MLRRVDLLLTEISEELRTSIIRVTKICELGTLVVTSNRHTLRRNTCHLGDGGATFLRNVGILHSHRRENIKSYNHEISFAVRLFSSPKLFANFGRKVV
jgi:hypothetical protein